MKISDLLRLSLSNLRRQKGRTILTVIGVVVGTCAIVVMISLGLAVNANNDALLATWGDLTMIQVYNYNNFSMDGAQTSSAVTLDDATIKTISEHEHVKAATPYYQPSNFLPTFYAGKNDRYRAQGGNIYGLYTDAMDDMGIQLKSGSWLDEKAVYAKDEIPVLLGSSFGYSFEDTKRSQSSPKRYRYEGQMDSKGQPVEPFVNIDTDKMELVLTDPDGKAVYTYKLVVVGVMEPNYNAGYFTAQGAVMRMTDLRRLEAQYCKINKITLSKTTSYSELHVKVDEVDNVAAVQDWLTKDMGFTDVYSMESVRKQLQSNVANSQMILGGLAAISLLVAALNIANTMTMAIYERTREIGVMKVLGCELGHIRGMFLVESGAIGLIGGLLGVGFSYLISFVLNNIVNICNWLGITADLSSLLANFGGISDGMGGGSGTISIVPLWLVALALIFATLVGLISGVVPANRAVKISALEAIRHD